MHGEPRLSVCERNAAAQKPLLTVPLKAAVTLRAKGGPGA